MDEYGQEQIYMDNTNYDENEDDYPMALIVEDEKFNQEFLTDKLKDIKMNCRIARTVNEAIQTYHELTEKHISIDVVFLDIILQDGSKGTDFLRMVRENKWMEKAMIIVMSGVEDTDIIRECHELKCQNFIQKPIRKNSFLSQSCIIVRHLESLKCPLEQYKIEKTLGSGASGVVELIRHKKTKQSFALKNIRIDPQGNYQKELNFMMLLKCPLILKLIEYKKIEDNLYLVLEYAENGSLSHNLNLMIQSKTHFDTEVILDWMTELFIGLFELHERNIMHRDIKSDNLLICKNNILKIGDLGIARATENNKAITVCGTFHYRAPEVTHYKEYINKVDIWSAGVVLYELIMQKVPFQGDSMEILKKIDSMEYEPLPNNTDERFKKLLSYMLIYNPNERLSAIDILKKDFMFERVKRLFESGIIEDNELYGRLVEKIKNTLFNLPIGFIKTDVDIQKDNEFTDYFQCFKTATMLDSIVLKTTYKPSLFSKYIDNVLLGSDIEMFIKDYNISLKEIHTLIDKKILLNISGNSKEFDEFAYYQIKLYEDINIDNSIDFPVEKQIQLDPINLSQVCLNQLISIKNKLDQFNEEEEDNRKWEIFFSKDYLEFLYNIKKLKYLKFDKYTSVEKLATILNIYQTMYLHLTIKNSNHHKIVNTGVMDMFKQVFSKSDNASNIVYCIGGQTLTLYEMKNIVIRRNKKPIDHYFRLVYDSDPRVRYIDENDNMLIKLHIVCLDPNEETDIDFNPIVFNDKVYEQLEEYCKNFITETVKRENETLNVPSLFKKYLVDFGNNEVDLVKHLLKIHTDSNLKPTHIVKLLNSKDINISYY